MNADDTPRLVLRPMGIDTWRENVAFVRRDCPLVRAEGLQPLAKVDVAANGTTIAAVLNVVDDPRLLGDCELGLSAQAFAQLGAAAGSTVTLTLAEPPASAAVLRRRLAGARLDAQEIDALVRDIAARRYSKVEMAAFLVATSQVPLDRDEVLHLTRAMVSAGRRLRWSDPRDGEAAEHPDLRVVDKHCIGGVPGNRTSMIVTPIVAAHAQETGAALLMPKTSSRAITSPAGTADTMACLAEVELPFERLREIVRRHRACLAWGGRASLSPADDVLISVSRPLSLDAPGQMVASILSKKIAAGATHLLLDIPLGPSAKVRTPEQAAELQRLFDYVAHETGLVLDVAITDGTQPVGRGIGPALEARDVLQVLHGDADAPADLRERSLALAGRVLEFDPALRGGAGPARALALLESGRALAAFERIVDAQGRHPFDRRAPAGAPLAHDVVAPHAGVVTAIDNLRMARIARLAGAPKAAAAGVDLRRRVGERVATGEALYRIHAVARAELDFARRASERGSGYTVA
jgi:thymidine phosphorylase